MLAMTKSVTKTHLPLELEWVVVLALRPRFQLKENKMMIIVYEKHFSNSISAEFDRQY